MEANEYPSNANGVKREPEKKKLEKIVAGPVKTRKKSEAKKLADVFISEDAQNVKSYIFMDVLIPAIKKAISDIVTNGIDMILYGEGGRPKKSGGGSKISYKDYYNRQSDRRDYRGASVQKGQDYEDIIFDNAGEAHRVLECLEDAIDRFGVVSIADLYDLAGLECPYTYGKYGWTDVRTARVIPTRDGWLIKLPKALPID